jgi:hypothetical protein
MPKQHSPGPGVLDPLREFQVRPYSDVVRRPGSVANSVFEGIEGFYLHILQKGIADFTGVF